MGAHPLMEQAYWLSQIVSACLQILLLIAAIVAGYIAYRQVDSFRLYELLKFTQDRDFRESRRIVIREIGDQVGLEWCKDPRLEAAASNCASQYDILGRMVQFGASKRVACFFTQHWSDSIVRTFDILRGFIYARRASGGLKYDAYERLYMAAKQHCDTPGPNWPPLDCAPKSKTPSTPNNE